MKLSTRFEHALAYAARAHCDQQRKATGIPYISHILGVTAIALEHGASEDEAIAALLHDVVEDCGGADRLRDVREQFGDEVAKIVEGCTDTDQVPKPPWRERKEAYIAHLSQAVASTRLVSASDKLHNASAIVRDLRKQGQVVWERFKGGKDGTLWYYRALVTAFRQHPEHAELTDDLDRTVTEMEKLASA
ncbi:MAG: HD domain-containing protein [Chthoniobacterales bacterium]|nr:HD domain-containing protein [Chthoniobacterales bacterium]